MPDFNFKLTNDMKYIKLFLILLTVSLVFSCQQTQVYEGTATIGFDYDTVSFSFPNSESSVNTVPITFTGSSNLWPIHATIEVVADYDGDGFEAVEDVDYRITSKDVFFGEPSDYADSVAANPGYATSITKNVEFTYPNSSKEEHDEIRVKLRIASYSHSDEIQTSQQEVVVKTSIPDMDRLTGIYDAVGELYTMQLTEVGKDDYGKTVYDTTFVASGESASFPVRVATSTTGEALVVRGLFCEDYDPVNDVNHGDMLSGNFVTQFTVNMESEESKTLSVTLGTANSSLNMANFYIYSPHVVTGQDNGVTFLPGPLTVNYDSTYSTLSFDLGTDNYFTIWLYSNTTTKVRPYSNGSFIKNLRFEKRAE